MNRKRLLLLILALLLGLVVPAAAISPPGPGTATKITITPSDIYVGELVTAQVTPGSDILRNVYYIFNWSGVTGSVTHRIDTGTDSVPAATSGNGSVSVELFYVHDNGYADTAMADFEVKTLPVASITITPATSRL